jgi:hypothetical protein
MDSETTKKLQDYHTIFPVGTLPSFVTPFSTLPTAWQSLENSMDQSRTPYEYEALQEFCILMPISLNTYSYMLLTDPSSDIKHPGLLIKIGLA